MWIAIEEYVRILISCLMIQIFVHDHEAKAKRMRFFIYISFFLDPLSTTPLPSAVAYVYHALPTIDHLGEALQILILQQQSVMSIWFLARLYATMGWNASMVFCYQNCSDLLWEKIVLVIGKNFWNLRLKAENLQNFWDH